MQISRTLTIIAPAGDAVHALGRCYTASAGRGMIESVIHHAFNGSYYYTNQSYLRLSDDNGETWRTHGPVTRVDPTAKRTREHSAARHFLDPTTGLLLAFYSDWLIASDEPQFASNTSAASYRPYYRISRDQGLTWEPPRQIIHRGPGYDEVNWLPGVRYGRNGGYVESCLPVALEDGTIVVGIVITPVDDLGKLYIPVGGYWYDTVFLRGKWNSARTELEWTSAAPIRVSPDVSSIGACEPDLIHLGGNRLFATLRCQGHAAKGVLSSRQGVVSEDGGATWSAPTPMHYDDGLPVFVPAAFSAFLRSPRTGKIYWFMNILDRGVYAQYPRCPLVMIELDPQRLCLLKHTFTVVQDLPPGAPPCTSDTPQTDEECGRQYTNFGAYVDRETGELVIVVTEMPRTTWAEFTSDVITIRVKD